MRSSIIIAGTAVVLAAGIALPAWSAGGQTDEVTFTKDIAPILQRSCQHCHRPDSIAPMSLLTYEEARPWARAIKQRTSLRRGRGAMPPWFIEKDIGIQRFKDDISLTEAEIAPKSASGQITERRAAILPTCRRLKSSRTTPHGRSAHPI